LSGSSATQNRPDGWPPPRDELVIKVLVAMRLPGVEVQELIQVHRRHLIELMQRYTHLKVYVGFGSMRAPKDVARVAIEAIPAHGRRALVARGWANLALIDDRDDCSVVGEVNQQALFGRVAELGIGTAHDGPAPTFESLSAALRTTLTPETRARAAAVAGTTRTDRRRWPRRCCSTRSAEKGRP
jgi:hypothetical protein